MIYLKKISRIISLIALLLFPAYTIVSAEQSDKMVNDYFQKEKGESEVEEPIVQEEQVQSPASAADFSFFDMFRMIAAFLFVGALLYFLLKFLNKKNQAYQKGHIVSNLGGTSVGNNKSIQIVKIGNKLYIVGVGENVQLLSEITDPEEIEKLLQDHNEAIDSMLKPADLLSKIKTKRVKDDSGNSFVEQFKKQLNEMATTRKQMKSEMRKTEDQKDE